MSLYIYVRILSVIHELAEIYPNTFFELRGIAVIIVQSGIS